MDIRRLNRSPLVSGTGETHRQSTSVRRASRRWRAPLRCRDELACATSGQELELPAQDHGYQAKQEIVRRY